MSIMFRDKSIIGLIFQVPSLGWCQFMYQSNWNSPHWQPPGHLTFWKIIVQISPHPNENAVQMPHILESIQVIKCLHPKDIKKLSVLSTMWELFKPSLQTLCNRQYSFYNLFCKSSAL